MQIQAVLGTKDWLAISGGLVSIKQDAKESILQVMNQAIDIHDRVMRGLLARYFGFEVTTEGDAFQFVFHHAADAVAYAVAAQQALLTAKWPPKLEQHFRTRTRYATETSSAEDAQMGQTKLSPGKGPFMHEWSQAQALKPPNWKGRYSTALQFRWAFLTRRVHFSWLQKVTQEHKVIIVIVTFSIVKISIFKPHIRPFHNCRKLVDRRLGARKSRQACVWDPVSGLSSQDGHSLWACWAVPDTSNKQPGRLSGRVPPPYLRKWSDLIWHAECIHEL